MSQGFIAEIDPNAAAAAEEAAAGGNGTFPPLPAGKYQVIVAKIKGVSDFGGTGGNAKKKILDVGFQIVDDSPTGKGRYVWARIPLFTRYAPSEKNPQGATARGFWDFWGKAIGQPQDQLILGQLPTEHETQGKRLTVTLSLKAPDQWNLLGSNEVSFFDKAGDVNQTPRRQPGVPVAAWLDADDNLIGGAAPAAPGAPAAAPASSAPPAWSATAPADANAAPEWKPDAADVAYAAPATPAVAGQGGF